MPAAVVAAIATEVFAAEVVSALSIALAETAISGSLIVSFGYAATAIAGNMVGGMLFGSNKGNDNTSAGFTSTATARTHIVRSAVANRQVVYGKAMISGPLVFANCSEDNSTLYLVVALASHQCDGIEDIYFNETKLGTLDADGNVIDGDFAGHVVVKKHLGTLGQAADDMLVSANIGWTSDHRLAGVTYLVFKLTWNKDVFPTGIPNIKALARGKPVVDPRTGLTAWSDNWALCTRDYLMADFGLQAPASEMGDSYFIAAANISDETITLAGGGTEKRYTCNGVVDLGNTPRTILEAMLAAGAGNLVFTAGKYRLYAGAYIAPTITLTADDLRGAIKVRPRVSRQNLYNAVRGTFVSPANLWVPTDFPSVSNSAYAADDGGAVIWTDIALSYTNSSAMAQRLSKIKLEKSRQGITVDFPAKLTAFKVQTGETVRLNIAQLGWVGKEFVVTSWQYAPAGGVDLVLQEESPACYDWNSGMETVVDPAPDTTLPNPFVVAAPGLPLIVEGLYQTTGSAGVRARASVSWAAPADAFVDSYELGWKLVSEAQWNSIQPIMETFSQVDDLVSGQYEFRVRAVNSIGQKSPWSITTVNFYGLMASPADITGLTVIKSSGFALMQCNLHPDLDVRIGGRIVVRHSPRVVGATWENSVIVEEFTGDTVTGLLPLMTGTYMAKAKDSSGNYSDNAAFFVATEGMVTGYTTVGNITLSTAFAGSKTNMAVLGGTLRLISTEGWDDAENIDSSDDIDGGNIAAQGQCLFSDVLDLTTNAIRRFQVEIASTSFDVGDYIDADEEIDASSDIDGSAINGTDATFYIATTPDDPSGTPVWSDWFPFFVGDFSARACKFRIDLHSTSPSQTIAITALSVTAKAPV